jgi:hypothetical protein
VWWSRHNNRTPAIVRRRVVFLPLCEGVVRLHGDAMCRVGRPLREACSLPAFVQSPKRSEPCIYHAVLEPFTMVLVLFYDKSCGVQVIRGNAKASENP